MMEKLRPLCWAIAACIPLNAHADESAQKEKAYGIEKIKKIASTKLDVKGPVRSYVVCGELNPSPAMNMQTALFWKAPDQVLAMAIDANQGVPILAGTLGKGFIFDVLNGRLLFVENEMAGPQFIFKVENESFEHNAIFGEQNRTINGVRQPFNMMEVIDIDPGTFLNAVKDEKLTKLSDGSMLLHALSTGETTRVIARVVPDAPIPLQSIALAPPTDDGQMDPKAFVTLSIMAEPEFPEGHFDLDPEKMRKAGIPVIVKQEMKDEEVIKAMVLFMAFSQASMNPEMRPRFEQMAGRKVDWEAELQRVAELRLKLEKYFEPQFKQAGEVRAIARKSLKKAK